ncbi:MAG: DUF2252 domain-containing protein [Coriobacteriales bacterium]|nr:DUF2252 domain-containing protein [Coriobacteriales bacterium]
MSKHFKSLKRNRPTAISTLLSDNEQRSASESKKYGKSLRKAVPRDVLATWTASSARPDPAELIFEQDKTRLKDLVPIRHERMSVSAFTFYRGAALIMASDLSMVPATGIEVQVCGDAHISNFGLFFSPERHTVFDINDFDETTRGPWEWDVARLAASVEICGRDRGFSDKQRKEAVLAAGQGYRKAMRSFAEMGNLDVWYAHLDIDGLRKAFDDKLDKKKRKRADKTLKKAKSKNSARAVAKLTEVVDGELRIKSDPPTIVPLRDLVEQSGREVPKDLDMAQLVARVLKSYRKTLPPERSTLIDRYRGVDIARKVVGVGSVGTRAWIVVLQGADESDCLVLQVKEASDSVLERFVGRAPQANHGQRVVEGQHAMQTVSDLFLGWTSMPVGEDGRRHDYYVRQLWDGKGSIDLGVVEPKQLKRLAMACGGTLAHAHARTGDRFAIASYLGKSDLFEQSLVSFANAYADQNEQDYRRFLTALTNMAE